jgi:hypothetical protein
MPFPLSFSSAGRYGAVMVFRLLPSVPVPAESLLQTDPDGTTGHAYALEVFQQTLAIPKGGDLHRGSDSF